MTWVVPPWSDPTLALDAPGEVVDLNRAFAARVLTATHARELLAACPAGDDRRLSLAAAAALLARPHDGLGALRAAALLLPALAEPTYTVDLRLDDLELRDGTTEDDGDVLAAVAGAAPYNQELSRAPSSGEVSLVIECDQQLPAALTLARQSAPALVTGRYARRYWETLRRIPGLADARLLPESPGWRVAGLPCAGPLGATPATELRWRERASDPVPDGRWAGRVSLRDLIRAPSRCAAAVIGICAIDRDEVLGRGGVPYPITEVRAAVASLTTGGASVRVELWVGAPGVDADCVRRTADALVADAGLGRLAGLRRFDWPVHWSNPSWNRRAVRLHPRTELALARTHAVAGDAPDELIRELAADLKTAHLLPGRIAAAYLDTPRAAPGPRVVLDPDTAVIDLPGEDTPFAVNARTGSTLKLGAQLADQLRALETPADPPQALPGRLLDALLDRQLLARC